MDGLRWILLAIGIVILFAIWWFGQQRSARRLVRPLEWEDSFDDWSSEEDDPLETAGIQDGTEDLVQQYEAEEMKHQMETDIYQSIEELNGLRGEEARIRPAPATFGSVGGMQPAQRYADAVQDAPVKSTEEKIVILHVAARKPSVFTGGALLRVFKGVELEHGEMQVFERVIDQQGRKQVLFRVASMVKPGIFDRDHMANLATPGVSLFMQLPGPIDGLLAFEAMLDCARELATRLGGNVVDESHEVLSAETIDHLREAIQEFNIRVRA